MLALEPGLVIIVLAGPLSLIGPRIGSASVWLRASIGA